MMSNKKGKKRKDDDISSMTNHEGFDYSNDVLGLDDDDFEMAMRTAKASDSGLAGSGFTDDNYNEFNDNSVFDATSPPTVRDEYDNVILGNLTGSVETADDDDFSEFYDSSVFDNLDFAGKVSTTNRNPWIDSAGNSIEPSKKDVDWLNSKLDIYAGNYNRETSLIAEQDLYNVRKAATREALLGWITTEQPSIPIVSNVTGKPSLGLHEEALYQDMTVPLPNELDIKGLVFTAAVGSNARGMNSGSPNTRQSFYDQFPKQSEVLDSNGNYDERAYSETAMGKLGPNQIKLISPSLSETFFPNMGDAGKVEMKNMENDFLRMRGIAGAMSSSAVPTKDYSGSEYDYIRLAAGMKALEENMSPLTRGYDSYVGLDGQPADRSLSEVGMLINRAMAGQDAGVSLDEVYAQVDDLYDVNDIIYRDSRSDVDVTGAAPFYVPDGSDRDLYRKRVSEGLENGRYFEQRTQGWHDQRKGLKTGSAVASIHTPGGQKRIAQDFANKARNKEDLDVLDAMIGQATDRLGSAGTESDIAAAQSTLDDAVELRRVFADSPTYEDKPFSSNYYMAQGTKFEDSVERSFENFSGLKVEEAYFETNPDYEGYGVSPDGFVFDKDGNSKGIAEFKMHNNEDGMKKSLKTYSHQLQLQMMVTGQESVHFYRTNMETSKVMYDIVRRDQKLIDKILIGGLAVDKLQEEIMSRTADIRDLPEGAAEAMAEMSRQRKDEEDRLAEEREGKKHGGFIEQIAPKTPDHTGYEADRATSLDGKNSKPNALRNLFSKAASKSADAAKVSKNAMALASDSVTDVSSNIETDKFTKREDEATKRGDKFRTDAENKELRKKQEADGAFYDIRYKNELAYNKLRIAAIKENTRLDKERANKFTSSLSAGFKSVVKTLGNLNKSGAKNAMGVANAASEVGMDGDRALGQIDAISTAGNMSFEDSANLVFSGAALQNEASGSVGGVQSFLNKQRQALTAASLNGSELSVMGIDEVRNMSPGDLLPKIMSNTEHMDRGTRAKVYRAFGLSGASRLGDRLDSDFLMVANKDLNETVLRGKDALTREENAINREVEYDMMASTPDEIMRVAARADFVGKNKAAAVYSSVSQVGDAISNIGNMPFNDGRAFGNLGKRGASGMGEPSHAQGAADGAVPSENLHVDVERAMMMPSDKISGATLSGGSRGAGTKVNVNSKLEVTINEETIDSRLVDDFGYTTISSQPRNGGQ